MPAFEVTSAPLDADVSIVSRGVLNHGKALAVDGNARPIACFVRNNGVVVAGAVGRTEYGRLFVNHVWVSENRRSNGLGTAILETLEREAIRLGCSSAVIETLNDRVAGLYSRSGYKTIAVVTQYVGPFNRHIMLKILPSAHLHSAA